MPYPGILQIVDATDVQVMVMHITGLNIFLAYDSIPPLHWYEHKNIILFIKQPGVGSMGQNGSIL